MRLPGIAARIGGEAGGRIGHLILDQEQREPVKQVAVRANA
jgi:hypothetical protein